MHQLVYRSIALDEEYGEADLDILLTALTFNRQNGITGFLWRGRGQFFQALHGARVIVVPLMERIKADPRHRDVEILMSEDTDQPTPFNDWAMGYDYISEDVLGVALDEAGNRPPVSPAKAHEIWLAMVEQARSEAHWGGSSPFGRKPGESLDGWISRLATARGR